MCIYKNCHNLISDIFVADAGEYINHVILVQHNFLKNITTPNSQMKRKLRSDIKISPRYARSKRDF